MSNDKQIEDYRKKVEAKHKELGEKPNPRYITNQLLKLGDKAQNLNLLRSVKACVEVTRHLQVQVLAQDKANQLLGTDEKLELGGYSADDWVADLRARVDLLQWQEEKTKLDAMDKKLSNLLSEDAKTANAIADIANELGL